MVLSSTLLNAGMYRPSASLHCRILLHLENMLTDFSSLEKEASRRATPWRMLEHPWMVEMQSKKVNMEHFLVQVWDWKD